MARPEIHAKQTSVSLVAIYACSYPSLSFGQFWDRLISAACVKNVTKFIDSAGSAREGRELLRRSRICLTLIFSVGALQKRIESI
jgi:hypothetical protein